MKELRCRELGFDCAGVVRAEGEDEILRQVAEHARSAHGIHEVTPELAQQVRGKIRAV